MTDINHVIAINTVALIKHYLQFLEEEMTVVLLHAILGVGSTALALLLIFLFKDMLKDIKHLIQVREEKTNNKAEKKEDEERIAKINAWLADLNICENTLKENLTADVRDAFNKRVTELNNNITVEKKLVHDKTLLSTVK